MAYRESHGDHRHSGPTSGNASPIWRGGKLGRERSLVSAPNRCSACQANSKYSKRTRRGVWSSAFRPFRIPSLRPFIVHAVYLPRPRIEISGPQGVQATFDWQAARDSVLDRMCTATLVNDVETY